MVLVVVAAVIIIIVMDDRIGALGGASIGVSPPRPNRTESWSMVGFCMHKTPFFRGFCENNLLTSSLVEKYYYFVKTPRFRGFCEGE